jgi:glutaredoxin
MIKDIGKNVRSMPQIKINDELVGGYNQLIEHYNKLGLVDFKGNKISE